MSKPPTTTTLIRSQVQTSAAVPPCSGLATAALGIGVLSILFWPLAYPGLILGALALVQIHRRGTGTGGTSNAIFGIIASAVGSLILYAAVLGVPSGHERARSASCQNNLKQQGTALLAYAQDYDGQFPDRAAWEDANLRYTKGHGVYHCPSLPDSPFGYAWNGKLSRLMLPKAPNPAATISIFDAAGTWNQSGGVKLIAPRHSNGLNIVFLDGHVKWLHPDRLHDFLWDPRHR